MKKLSAALVILSLATVFTAAKDLDIRYPDDRTLLIEAELGEFHVYQWYEGDRRFTRYSFDHTNNMVTDGDAAYEILQLPLAVGGRVPDIDVSVLESEATEHAFPEQELFSVSRVLQYRDRKFVYLTINPFLENGRVATRLQVRADMHTASGRAEPDISNRFFVNREYADGLRSIRTEQAPSFGKAPVFSGQWLDLTVSEEGIYSIKRSGLEAAGVSASFGDDELYLFAGRSFGAPLRDSFPDSSVFHLKEVPMLFLSGADPADDQWVFYASPASAWERGSDNADIRSQRFVRNSYESVQHFRLFAGSAGQAPRRMDTDVPAFTGSEVPQEYTYQRLHYENEQINPAKGGELWLGERLSASNTFDFYLDPIYRNEDVPAALRLGFGVTSAGAHEFEVRCSDSLLYELSFSNAKSAESYDYESTIARGGQLFLDNGLLEREFELEVAYRGEFAASEGFLDYIDIIYPSRTEAIDGALSLWFPPGEVPLRVQVSGLTGSVSYVFDVEDPFNTDYYPVSGSTAAIRVPASETGASYHVLNEGHFRSPESLTLLTGYSPVNTEDHAEQKDLIIITPEAFLTEARRLAGHKESRLTRPLRTLVKSYGEIAGQFNAGNRDPHAIRHFLSNVYHHAPDPGPRYVLLLGDGHYDYQNRIYSDPVHIPYLYETGVTWPCDDIFVMVSSAEDVTNDMAVGRIPSNSIEETRAVVDKIIEYDNRENPGEWQLNAMLVADDPTDLAQGPSFVGQTAFIRDSERLHDQYLPKVIQSKKIYLTEYPERFVTELQTMGRDGAREDIMETFLNGAAFVNFYGHGDASVWTQEKVFVKNDLQRLNVNRRYPIILAATCSWGRSDTPDFQSAAEAIVTLDANGAIATIATVRSVFHGSSSSANVKFVEDLMTGLFPGNPDFAYTPLLGDAMLYAKNESNNVYGTSRINNNMKFMLFGDPSLIPAFPQDAGMIDHIGSDTLRALDRIAVSGHALDREGTRIQDPDLEGRITVYDNNYRVSRDYVYNAFGDISQVSYYLQGSRLFNGNVSFGAGAFSSEVFIPKDIQYHGNRGKVRMMYWNSDHRLEGTAAVDTIHVGGINPDAESDVTGPEIALHSNGLLLNHGAVLYDTSRIRIVFSDQSGINITGTAGHVLEMQIDNGAATVDLSELFSYHRDDYTRGYVEFPVGNYLDEGEHRLEISAFDNYNNFSRAELSLTVIRDDSELIRHLVNFPNPFKDNTDITFSSAVEGNAAVRVYTISGKPVSRLEDRRVSRGFNAIPWQASDDYGNPLAAGVYFYVLEIETDDRVFTRQNKLMILP